MNTEPTPEQRARALAGMEEFESTLLTYVEYFGECLRSREVDIVALRCEQLAVAAGLALVRKPDRALGDLPAYPRRMWRMVGREIGLRVEIPKTWPRDWNPRVHRPRPEENQEA